jgi:penicillin-insensitive murein endopeptidase
LNSVALDSANGIEVVDPAHAWGTQETVDFVKAGVAVVRAQFPNTPTLYVGHLSARNGGPLAPHLSHQSGRDVDSGYYYLDGARWYAPATAENLDAPRTWALIRALTGESDVEMILIDRSVQPILRQYALRAGEPSEWVEELFQGVPGKVPPLIRHAAGHRTHMHIRFYNPIAQETGRRLYPLLLKQRLLDPPVYFVRHRAKRGETLARIARRYGTSVEAIVRANNLRSTRIREGHDYRIPRAGPVRWVSRQLEFPPRRRPPKHASIPDQLTAK